VAEKDVIERTPLPLTVDSLVERLRGCGVEAGQTVLVHMAMSKLGWIAGGAEAVIWALLDALGPAGTLMMPAHTGSNTDPAEWQFPPVPPDWWPIIRAHTPAYDPARTPTRGMGTAAELFRTWPGVVRSAHPVTSFAAHGPNAAYLTADHALEEDLGNRSPLGRLYDLGGYVLLLGVGHWNNTSLHLAEFRADFRGKRLLHSGCAMQVDGQRQWVEYDTLLLSTDDFGPVGDAFDAAHPVKVHQIVDAEVRFFPQRALVDFAVPWMEQHRDLPEE